jgi:hypothetical protein
MSSASMTQAIRGAKLVPQFIIQAQAVTNFLRNGRRLKSCALSGVRRREFGETASEIVM